MVSRGTARLALGRLRPAPGTPCGARWRRPVALAGTPYLRVAAVAPGRVLQLRVRVPFPFVAEHRPAVRRGRVRVPVTCWPPAPLLPFSCRWTVAYKSCLFSVLLGTGHFLRRDWVLSILPGGPSPSGTQQGHLPAFVARGGWGSRGSWGDRDRCRKLTGRLPFCSSPLRTKLHPSGVLIPEEVLAPRVPRQLE